MLEKWKNTNFRFWRPSKGVLEAPKKSEKNQGSVFWSQEQNLIHIKQPKHMQTYTYSKKSMHVCYFFIFTLIQPFFSSWRHNYVQPRAQIGDLAFGYQVKDIDF